MGVKEKGTEQGDKKKNKPRRQEPWHKYTDAETNLYMRYIPARRTFLSFLGAGQAGATV